jgi:hypothetical protein
VAATILTNYAAAAPPLVERLAGYRVVDASGRIAYRTAEATPGSGRVAYRPSYSPPYLMRARPYYLAGYAGVNYGPPLRPRATLGPAPIADITPTSHRQGGLFHLFGHD